MKDCDDSSRHLSPRQQAFLISNISGDGARGGPPADRQSTMSAAVYVVSMYATNSTCGLASFSAWKCLHICTGVMAETQKAECFLKEQMCICQTYFQALIYNRGTTLISETSPKKKTSWLHPFLGSTSQALNIVITNKVTTGSSWCKKS